MQFQPVQSERSYTMVARSIEGHILSGAIRPGEAMPPETELAAQFGVNRSTVREAIRMLEETGFVRREAGRKKLRVSIPRPQEMSRRLAASIVLSQVTFEELWELMLALEPAAAEAAASRADADLLGALDANLARTRAALQDNAALSELDIEFHDLVAAGSRNRALQIARQPVTGLFYPAFHAVISRLNAGERLLAAHAEILLALRAQDAAKARGWMERHIHDFRRGYELANLDMRSPVTENPP